MHEALSTVIFYHISWAARGAMCAKPDACFAGAAAFSAALLLFLAWFWSVFALLLNLGLEALKWCSPCWPHEIFRKSQFLSVFIYMSACIHTYVYVNKSEDIRLFGPALKPVQTLVVMEKWRIQCDSVAAFDFILDRVWWAEGLRTGYKLNTRLISR